MRQWKTFFRARQRKKLNEKMACRAVARFALQNSARLRTLCFDAATLTLASRRAKVGGLGETRTLDQCLRRALLYRLSYQPIIRRRQSETVSQISEALAQT